MISQAESRLQDELPGNTKGVLFFVVLLGGMSPSPFFLYPSVLSSFSQALSSHRRSLSQLVSSVSVRGAGHFSHPGADWMTWDVGRALTD